MKELLILSLGIVQSALIWTILRLRDKVKILDEENTDLAKFILKWLQENPNDN